MALFGKTSERLLRIRSRSTGFAGSAGDSAGERGASQSGAGGFPGSRELRSQAVHRLQVGMFGLAAMLLLVSLASVIMQRVQTADRSTMAQGVGGSSVGSPSGSASASPASDPLADLGVAPEVPVGGATTPARKPARSDQGH
jgi:hypothetical protein